MIPDMTHDHRDWTDSNTSNSVYDQFLRAGFHPVELWMIDFARAGEQMSSIEEATDDLKFFICAVMQYTGADRVQILAHGTGCLLARLTLQKYNIAHWVDSEVYIDAPFHGLNPAPDPMLSLKGYPNAWTLSLGSDLLTEILSRGESPVYRKPETGEPFQLRTLTLRAGTEPDDSACLFGADNVSLPGLDHDGLRCAGAATRVYIPFLSRSAAPLKPAQDADRDGFRAARFGGPDLDDGNPDIYPGAPEILGDGIDQDCTGCDLSVNRGRDGEIPLTR